MVMTTFVMMMIVIAIHDGNCNVIAYINGSDKYGGITLTVSLLLYCCKCPGNAVGLTFCLLLLPLLESVIVLCFVVRTLCPF